jgi:peptidoglycan hydrolase-like protein with peptidoglycan-binding domain
LSSKRANLVFMLSAALIASPAFGTPTHRTLASKTSAGRTTVSGHGRTTRKAAPRSKKVHGQQAIEPDRVTEIQQALIREHYLSAEANGKWDSTTEAAMQKYQSDQGWQTKLMPDSRALKKLGLGPDYSGAINARNASFGAPPPAGAIPTEQAAGFAEASRINR